MLTTSKVMKAVETLYTKSNPIWMMATENLRHLWCHPVANESKPTVRILRDISRLNNLILPILRKIPSKKFVLQQLEVIFSRWCHAR